MVDVTHDPQADAVYIRVGGGQFARTEHAGPFIYDVDAEGRIIGIEILSASKVLSPGAWLNAPRPEEALDADAVEALFTPPKIQLGLNALRLEAKGFRFDAIACGAPDAPIVLFLHGWPSFATSWRAIMPLVAAAGFRAVAVDQRGYSPGARPGAVADYAVDCLLADIEGFARALARSARFHLVGHDWGGLIAWPYAAHHPERLASLTVLSTPHSKAFLEAIKTDPEQQRMSAYIVVFPQPRHVPAPALPRHRAP